MPVRRLEIPDLPSILHVQRQCYRSELLEGGETFRRKILGFPEGCLGLEREGRLGGYLFCQPWRFGEVVPLDDASGTSPPGSDCLYLHDLSVIPAWRGSGAATELLEAAFTMARVRGFTRFGLVAVQGSESFWKGRGFRMARAFEYAPGVPATYMTREGG